jgi:hypothetical protein
MKLLTAAQLGGGSSRFLGHLRYASFACAVLAQCQKKKTLRQGQQFLQVAVV